jgi:hypothetical protein
MSIKEEKKEPKKNKKEKEKKEPIVFKTITFKLDNCKTVKQVTFCPNCGKRRSLISQPNTPHVLECQECKVQISIVEHD